MPKSRRVSASMVGWAKYLRLGRRSDWFRRYGEYLQSPAWRERRRAALLRSGSRCQICGATRALQVHHVTYVRVGEEFPDDLRVVCVECHVEIHNTGNTYIPLDKATRQAALSRYEAKSPPAKAKTRRRPAETAS